MSKQEETIRKYVTTPTFLMPEGICLNNQHVENLIKYLQGFPADAKVVINHCDREGNYHNYDCQIACNFDYQHKENIVQLILGLPID